MANIEHQLQRYLFRSFCPTSIELGEYALDVLERDKAQLIKKHLKDCPHCEQELRLLRNYLNDLSDDLELSRVERVNIWVGKLVSAAGTHMPAFAAAQRGGEENVLVYQAGDAQVSLQIRPSQTDPKLRDVYGLVIGIDPTGWLASLWQDTSKIAVSEIDELSSFSLRGIQPDHFTLILSSPTSEIHIEVNELQS
jgi:hypothetical protein